MIKCTRGLFTSLVLALTHVACGGGSGGDGETAPPIAANEEASASSNANLAGLELSAGSLSPTFDAAGTTYTATVGFLAKSVTVTAMAADAAATITVNGTSASSRTPSGIITLNEGSNTILIVVTAEDGTTNTYSVTVTRQSGWTFAQEAYVKASNTGATDLFGACVALSGDTLAVGAYQEDSNATGIGGNQANDNGVNTGAVYVFIRTGATWSQQAYIKASNPGVHSDKFGFSVALSGDTLAVGAPQQAGSGAVYVFARTRTTWSQQAYLKGSNSQGADHFGGRVALSGDTLAVAAVREASNATGIDGNQADNSALESGAVYLFTRTGDIWSQQAYIKASNTEATDFFGYGLALSRDTLAVGAYQEDSHATGVGGNQADNSALDSGAVYVFARTGATWSQQAYIKASNTGATDRFGFSVALSGDTLAVGACQEDSHATGIDGNQVDDTALDSGAVYVFTRTGDIWSQRAYIKASNTGAIDRFGFSVALSEDTLVVGAYQEDSHATGIGGNQANNSALESGAVYVFARTGDIWSQEAYIKGSNTAGGDFFGISVALSGDTFAVGALEESSNATGIDGNQADNSAHAAGAVYIFR